MTEVERKLFKDFVQIWINSHPDEIAMLIENRTYLKNIQQNKLGSNKSMTMRHAMELPVDLARKITNNFPNILKDKDQLHWFMTEYPIFTIAEKI